MKQATDKKRTYEKPEITSIKIDNQISMVMMTEEPPGDDELSHTEVDNPYKITHA